MHIAEGVLDAPTLIAAASFTTIGIAIGLRQLTPQMLPSAALFAAVFFLVGTIHIPIGVGSVHLILNGLIGLLLGWLAFPVLFVALALQALLFSFGGFTALGANTLLMALPAVVAGLLLRPFLKRYSSSPRTLMTIGALAATIGIVGATGLAALMLWSTGREALLGLVTLLAAAQTPVWIIDAIVTALAVSMLGRARPKIFTFDQ
ncbi:MAG: cobalt transporter CbiM [Steroidobacteraceae bacterium]|jgi:cobalt/nickel transport system permease protein